jgi:hypothetical protein
MRSTVTPTTPDSRRRPWNDDHANTRQVTINGNHTVHGSSTSISVNGNDNAVVADAVDRITVSGNTNTAK